MNLRPINKDRIEQKARRFFHSKKWQDLLVFFVFLIIASVFWLMQYARQTGEHDASTAARHLYPEAGLAGDSLREHGREIPIRINGSLLPAAGYRFIDSLHIDPQTVWVSGDAALLDTLQWIGTLPVKEEKIQKKLALTLKLQVPKGLIASVRQARVSAELEEYAEKKIELPVTCIHLPNDRHVRFFPSTVEIVCYPALTDYPSLKAEDLSVGADYNELIQNTGVNISLTLLHKPTWLDDYRIVPETVEYLIEQKRDL
jgi:hypothetical protein